MFIFLRFNSLNNFSKKTTSCNYYFSDEMSLTGRVISASIYKGGANKTIGVQHGLISDNHTIYRITDNEQTGQKTVPLPDKLFIWDNIFKKRLLLNSDIIKKRVEIINNEQYDHLRREVQSQKKYQYKKTKNILWCTTLPEHFIFEANILKNINSKEYNIMVRLHPVGHITENFIKEILSNKLSYTISKNNLTSDFIFADIVITNPFSTIFYDAINVGIPVIRILHFSTYIDFKEDFKGKLFDVFNYKQLQKILENDGIYNFNIKN